MSQEVFEPTLPTWAQDLQYACPRCRANIDLREGVVMSCSTCGFETQIVRGIHCFVATSDVVDDWRNTYENLAASPLGDTSAGVQYRSLRQQGYIVAAFRGLCGEVPEGTRILDVGCGNGLFRQTLLPERNVVGVDYAIGMCAIARARGMLAYQADALALPFADEQFDLVYAPEMMQHLSNLKALFAELARVCRGGGKIVVSTSNRFSLARQGMLWLRRLRPHPVDSKNPPILMRTVGEVSAAARGLPLSLQGVCWTHFPLPLLRYSSSARYLFAPFASNFAVSFGKIPLN